MSEDINNWRQNHPELIVRDLQPHVDPEIVRHALKFRGVNKWLRVRRLLIALKHRWKDVVQAIHKERVSLDEYSTRRAYLQGYEEALINCRQQVRALCHSPRDVDFPEKPRDFGDICKLPENFPDKPNRKYFWNH